MRNQRQIIIQKFGSFIRYKDRKISLPVSFVQIEVNDKSDSFLYFSKPFKVHPSSAQLDLAENITNWQNWKLPPKNLKTINITFEKAREYFLNWTSSLDAIEPVIKNTQENSLGLISSPSLPFSSSAKALQGKRKVHFIYKEEDKSIDAPAPKRINVAPLFDF